MKKVLLFTAVFTYVSSSFAQLDAINNAQFDNWTNNEPDGWGSSNAAYPTQTGSVTQATGGDILGTNTLALTTKDSLGTALPGVVVFGGTFSLNTLTPVVDGFALYRIRPLALTFVSKYTAGGAGDAPLVQVILTKWNPNLSRRDTVSISRVTPVDATYTNQTLDISYTNTPIGGNPTTISNYAGGGVTPDSIQILISSSGTTGAVANSTFFIDSLAFVQNCDLDPTITTSGGVPVLLPNESDTLIATAGQPFSFKITSYIPATVTMVVPFGGNSFPLASTIDSVQVNSSSLSGSAANFITVDPTPTGGVASGNSISCLSFSGTIPASPANATYNLILTNSIWGSSFVATLVEFPSPITSTYTIKVGNGSPQLTSTDNIKWKNMQYNGENRVYNVYVPSTYDGSTAVPLVFNIHGWTGSSTKQMDCGDFRSIADTANFIIVHPQALGDIPSWDLTGTTDTDFLMTLLDSLESQYNIDPNRIYSTGFSQGGLMSNLFGCFHSNRIAAIAPVAGGMSTETLANCTPSRAVPVMEIHGTTDQLSAYTASATSPGVQDVLDYWVGHNSCNSTPVITPLTDVTTADNSTVEHYIYSGGIDGATVEHYKVTEGGHQWPATATVKNNYGIGTKNLDFNASKEIWRFFSQYSLDMFTTVVSISETESDNIVTLSPNPSNGIFNLRVNNYANAKVVISDVVGSVVFSAQLTSQSTTIDLGNITSGIYIYQIQFASGETSGGKIVIQ